MIVPCVNLGIEEHKQDYWISCIEFPISCELACIADLNTVHPTDTQTHKNIAEASSVDLLWSPHSEGEYRDSR